MTLADGLGLLAEAEFLFRSTNTLVLRDEGTTGPYSP